MCNACTFYEAWIAYTNHVICLLLALTESVKHLNLLEHRSRCMITTEFIHLYIIHKFHSIYYNIRSRKNRPTLSFSKNIFFFQLVIQRCRWNFLIASNNNHKKSLVIRVSDERFNSSGRSVLCNKNDNHLVTRGIHRAGIHKVQIFTAYFDYNDLRYKIFTIAVSNRKILFS
jgi:hypothetical protein